MTVNYASRTVEGAILLPSFVCFGLIFGQLPPLVWVVGLVGTLLILGWIYRCMVVGALARNRAPAIWAGMLVVAQALGWALAIPVLMTWAGA